MKTVGDSHGLSVREILDAYRILLESDRALAAIASNSQSDGERNSDLFRQEFENRQRNLERQFGEEVARAFLTLR